MNSRINKYTQEHFIYELLSIRTNVTYQIHVITYQIHVITYQIHVITLQSWISFYQTPDQFLAEVLTLIFVYSMLVNKLEGVVAFIFIFSHHLLCNSTYTITKTTQLRKMLNFLSLAVTHNLVADFVGQWRGGGEGGIFIIACQGVTFVLIFQYINCQHIGSYSRQL